MSGRPGPVVLALPEDVLAEEADVADAPPVEAPRLVPSAEELGRVRELLAAAERPLVVVGEGGWTSETSRDVLAFCEANALPGRVRVPLPGLRRQPLVELRRRPRRRDGRADRRAAARRGPRARDRRPARRGARPGGTRCSSPRDLGQTLVHVHPDPAELGAVYETDLPIAATLPEFAAAAAALEPVEPRWRAWTESARADYEENLVHEPMEGPVDLGEVMAFLRAHLPGDAVQTCGAGNFTVWAHRFAEFTQFGTQACPRSGSMGYGLPAAVAAKLVHPDRIAVCFTGDGDFVMSSPELATAVQYELPILVLLVNNGMYATIRMHQERQFPGRVVGTDLANPDFVELARAYGAHGERVERTEQFEERSSAPSRPAGRP